MHSLKHTHSMYVNTQLLSNFLQTFFAMKLNALPYLFYVKSPNCHNICSVFVLPEQIIV